MFIISISLLHDESTRYTSASFTGHRLPRVLYYQRLLVAMVAADRRAHEEMMFIRSLPPPARQARHAAFFPRQASALVAFYRHCSCRHRGEFGW